MDVWVGGWLNGWMGGGRWVDGWVVEGIDAFQVQDSGFLLRQD